VRRVAAQLPALPRENILAEPCGRGSAPAIAWAAATIRQRWGNEVMASLHSDHHVANPEALRQGLLAAQQAARLGRIVTLGIPPTRPHTGLGHIQRGAALGVFNGVSAYAIRRFVEKPPLPRAIEYTESGEYYWNTGMFVWQVESLLHEIAEHMPGLAAAVTALSGSLGTSGEKRAVNRLWPTLATEQIDYGVMEKTSLGAVVPVQDMGWSDLGDWNSLVDTRAADGQGNIVVGDHTLIDTSGSIVVGTSRRLIGMIGLSDMIVVETSDAILVCPRSRAQDVRKLVNQLRAEKKERYL
jgi:mannose-1-phosphate guanylyltransferase